MTLLSEFKLIALLCEENGFWPDSYNDLYSDIDCILDHHLVAEKQLLYTREVTSRKAIMEEITYNKKHPEHWASCEDLMTEDYSTCHIDVMLNYAEQYASLRWFYTHDNDYDCKILWYTTQDLKEIIHILKEFNL